MGDAAGQLRRSRKTETTDNEGSLSHTSRGCVCHVVMIPKHGRKVPCGEAKRGMREILAMLAGVAIPQVSESHKSSDFVGFLRKLDGAYPGGDVIRLILDNHSAHVSRETQEYLNTVPGRFAFVFTPTHGSWLNLVEAFFGKLARQMLKGIRVRGKEELRERILLWFDEVNEVPVPYRWTWGLDDIDLGSEDVDAIPFEVVNAKACRPEDRRKKAPTPPGRGRRPKKQTAQTGR